MQEHFITREVKNYDSIRGIFAGTDENGKAATVNERKGYKRDKKLTIWTSRRA